MTLAISVDQVTVRFGGNEVLRDLSLEVASGECLGIIGPNGCGKSTLLNLINGFVVPDSGRVRLFGELISDMPPFQRARRGLGRVFQHSGIFRELTVKENIQVASDVKGRKATDSEVQEALSSVGIAPLSEKLAGDLSGGQQRLLELARARAMQPSVLLLDEPTAGVAPKMRHEVLDFIVKLRNEGCTILVVEHNMQFIQDLCSRVVLLFEGGVALDGPPSEVRSSPLLKEVYLGRE